MDMNKELTGESDARLVGLLASAYTLLALAPYDSWGHQGTPGDMAAYVVRVSKERGNLGFLKDIFRVRG